MLRFDIGNNTGHTADEALLVRNFTKILDCLHGVIGRSRIVEQNAPGSSQPAR